MNFRSVAAAGLVTIVLTTAPAHAEVKSTAADHIQLLFTERVAAPPAAVYAAIGQIERWWSGEHSYSGDAANLSLSMQPGG